MSRKDGRPRTVTPKICLDHDLPLDDYPWEHPNGGRIPMRYGVEQDTWSPRRHHCQDWACYV